MNLTPGQLRAALRLSQDAYRHWKTVLVPLGARKGRGTHFTYGDLLALAIIKSLTDNIGAPVGNLSQLAEALFSACNEQSWARLERVTALICPTDWSLQFISENQPAPTGHLTIAVPCGPIIASLRTILMIDQVEEVQTTFRFPLSAITKERGGQNL